MSREEVTSLETSGGVEKKFQKYDPIRTPFGDLTDPYNEEGKEAVVSGKITLDGQMLVDLAKERNTTPLVVTRPAKKELPPKEDSSSRKLKNEIEAVAEKHGYRMRVHREGNGEGEYFAYLWLADNKNREANLRFRGSELEDVLEDIEHHFGEHIEST